ncbi:hypothetical protein HOG98_09115 [bacterium]|jgi:chemotaxis protein MotA|nr:hypothetical protein [bacterium]
MDINGILGIALTYAAFYYGVPALRESFSVYVDVNSFILVFGGTVSATLLSTSWKEFKAILVVFKQLVFKPKKLDPKVAVSLLVKISELSQTQSKQSLVKEGEGVGDGFLEHGLGLVGAGLDRAFIEKALETDINEIKRRHDSVISKVRTMGTFAPMFGMVGTVIGVTQVLQNVTDIDTIVSGMSLALLTTLYGLILSTVIFIPTANKLKGKSAKELVTKEIIVQGILSILDKEIPLKVEKYLMAFLETKAKTEQKGKKGK